MVSLLARCGFGGSPQKSSGSDSIHHTQVCATPVRRPGIDQLASCLDHPASRVLEHGTCATNLQRYCSTEAASRFANSLIFDHTKAFQFALKFADARECRVIAILMPLPFSRVERPPQTHLPVMHCEGVAPAICHLSLLRVGFCELVTLMRNGAFHECYHPFRARFSDMGTKKRAVKWRIEGLGGKYAIA